MSLKTILNSIISKFKRSTEQEITNAVVNAAAAAATKTYPVKLSPLPKSVDDLKQYDLTKPENTVALTIAALCMYPTDKEACYAMLDYLMGPENLSQQDKLFIRDRFMDGVDYIPRSYFKGATPENDYQGEEGNIEVLELAHTRDIEKDGYLTFWVRSGGADSPREVRVRTKPSTGEWFVNMFTGLLPGIRTPKSRDKWA